MALTLLTPSPTLCEGEGEHRSGPEWTPLPHAGEGIKG
jgi:hypothetical protein